MRDAVNFAGGVDYRWTGFEPDAGGKLRLAGAGSCGSNH
jgi:hypothetical protein